jgi:chaperonin GroES
VVVRLSKREEMTSCGIVLPDTAGEKRQEGTVVAVGRGRLNDGGRRVVPEVKAGDTVLYATHAGIEVTVAGEDLRTLRAVDAVVVFT